MQDAHEAIRRLTLECEKTGKTLVEALQGDPAVWTRVQSALVAVGGPEAERFFTTPALYRGIAGKKALRIAERYRERMKKLREEL